MSLSLSLAHVQLQNKLQALNLNHLRVRVQDTNLIIYSVRNGEYSDRAVFTCFPGNEFILSVANHRGEWQPTPYVGSWPELFAILTDKLMFALSRWG